MSKLNIPTDLYDALTVEANNNCRTPTMQLIYILRQHLKTSVVQHKEPVAAPIVGSGENRYAGLTGDALMDAMDADSRKYYESRE